jgi:hypothetical protein
VKDCDKLQNAEMSAADHIDHTRLVQSPHFSLSSSLRKSGSPDGRFSSPKPTIECKIDTPLPAGVTLNVPSKRVICRETSVSVYESRSPG